MKQILRTTIISLVVGSAAAFLVTSSMLKNQQDRSEQDIIKDFYTTETLVHVSPHHIRKAIAKGDDSFILVDLRSQEEYEQEHAIGAINIPAYKDSDTSDYGDVERIVAEFKKLPADKDVIVYCYSMPCMTGRKIGKILADHGVYVKHLGIGWNEWRYHWDLWNHAHEWEQTNVDDYVIAGKDPGKFKAEGEIPEACPIESDLGC
jgi:rhodanese-related sulfurtransferase